jgi:hypothetical protein
VRVIVIEKITKFVEMQKMHSLYTSHRLESARFVQNGSNFDYEYDYAHEHEMLGKQMLGKTGEH